jgi:hypothetical protein
MSPIHRQALLAFRTFMADYCLKHRDAAISVNNLLPSEAVHAQNHSIPYRYSMYTSNATLLCRYPLRQ